MLGSPTCHSIITTVICRVFAHPPRAASRYATSTFCPFAGFPPCASLAYRNANLTHLLLCGKPTPRFSLPLPPCHFRTPPPITNSTSNQRKTRPTHSGSKDLSSLSSLGHFLKGSSAALGVIKVQAACEKIQHYGHLRDEEVGEALEESEALKRITTLLKECKRSYGIAKAWLTRLYEEEGAGAA